MDVVGEWVVSEVAEEVSEVAEEVEVAASEVEEEDEHGYFKSWPAASKSILYIFYQFMPLLLWAIPNRGIFKI